VIAALDVLVRIPAGFNDDASLFCVGEAPDFESSACVGEMAELPGATNGEIRRQLLLDYYRAGRRMHFGEAAAHETVQRESRTDAATLFGALSSFG
jgi:hypothetical protein